MKLELELWCALLAVVALPFVLDASTGCSFHTEQRLDNTIILIGDPDLDFLNGRFIGLVFRDTGRIP